MVNLFEVPYSSDEGRYCLDEAKDWPSNNQTAKWFVGNKNTLNRTT